MEKRKIVFFDGVCLLCSSFADLIIEQDRRDEFALSPLQGKKATQLLSKELREQLTTVVLYDNGKIYTHSEAAIRVLCQLSFPFSLAKILLLVPKAIRDALYVALSKNRYKLFGKSDSCRMPTESEKRKFIP